LSTNLYGPDVKVDKPADPKYICVYLFIDQDNCATALRA
jgi:hypothetical protein